jgi:D-alanine--poly(phosphoribitol) ligase subunit 1
MGRTIFGIDKNMIGNFKELFEYFKKSKIAMWISTPSLVEMCMVDKNFNKSLLPDLEKLFVAGEVLTNNLVNSVFERFGDIELINGYGPTEATVLVTAIGMDKNQAKELEPIPLGYPMDNCLIKIVDDTGAEVPEGEKGEIILVGDSVSIGYHNNPEMSEKSFFRVQVADGEKRAYRTGDVGYIKNGLVYYCGRKDFQIQLDGFRIELEDVENNLRKINFVSNAVVLPVKKEGKVTHLCAFVTLNQRIEEKDSKIVLRIKDELKKLIPPYMVPRLVKIKNLFPTNPNGKINRELLLEEIR